MNVFKITALIFLILLSACNGTVQKDEQPVITVSILPQKYLVERIAGSNFRINVLVPPGSSAETYEPTPLQMQDISKSALYFRIGYMEFENTLIRNIQAQNKGVNFVNTADGIELIAADIVDHGDHVHMYGVDPHVWLSIPEVKIQLKNITGALIGIDPENADYYNNNYNLFTDELTELHNTLLEKFSSSKRKTFLIFHPALGYFARDYGLSQISIEMDGKSPTAANMKRVIDLARKEDINDVFIQMEFERESALAVSRELGGKVIEINPLAENWLTNFKDMSDVIYQTMNK
jgi:zinc transport system substrate-binding protein